VGKTTTGDYLGTYCGLHHLDGDDDMRRPDDAVRKAATEGLVKAFFEYWFKDKAAPVELWHPYHQLLCDRIVAALSTHGDVVVSFSVYRREVRDFLREQLQSRAELRFVKLECDADVVVKGALARLEGFMSLQDKTVEDWWATSKHDSTYGAFSFDNFKQMQMATVLSGFEPLAQDEVDCIVVDVSARDASCFHRVTAALQLPPGPDAPDIEMLAALQKARYEKLIELNAQQKAKQ
jgi:gluconate kinase